jgi:hypothetical protein
MSTHKTDNDCQQLVVPREVCYLRFSEAPIAESRDIDLSTARREILIVDLDREGNVIGMELLGPGKPCQPL